MSKNREERKKRKGEGGEGTSLGSHLIVRKAVLGDLDRLVEFNVAMAWETEGRRLQRHRVRSGAKAVLNCGSHGLYVVGEIPEDGKVGTVVSQLLITFEWSDWRNGNFWWMQSVYVHPDWRNRKVFHRMYHYILKEAHTRSDVCGIRLYVENENTRAMETYAKLGLVPTSYRMFENDFVLPPMKKK